MRCDINNVRWRPYGCRCYLPSLLEHFLGLLTANMYLQEVWTTFKGMWYKWHMNTGLLSSFNIHHPEITSRSEPHEEAEGREWSFATSSPTSLLSPLLILDVSCLAYPCFKIHTRLLLFLPVPPRAALWFPPLCVPSASTWSCSLKDKCCLTISESLCAISQYTVPFFEGQVLPHNFCLFMCHQDVRWSRSLKDKYCLTISISPCAISEYVVSFLQGQVQVYNWVYSYS